MVLNRKQEKEKVIYASVDENIIRADSIVFNEESLDASLRTTFTIVLPISDDNLIEEQE